MSYGAQTVTFSDLNPGTYNVAIFPYTNSGENINYKTDGNYPTAVETTEMIQCLFASDFANGLEPFSAINVEGEQVWLTGTYQGTAYAKMSGYSGGANHANEDWLITPNLLNGETYASYTVSFMNAYKFAGNALQLLYSEDYDGMSDPNEFGWVDITGNFDWDIDDDNYVWVSTEYTLVNMQDVNNLYFAFKFTSTDDASSTWEVAEFKVFTDYDSVDENEAVKFNLYPNPANSNLNIVAESPAMAQIIDMAGRLMMNVNVVEGENSINISELESGVYFVRINNAVVKFVKR